MKLKQQCFLALFGAIFFSSASAEVFRCEQADGTTVFSFVSCEANTQVTKQSHRNEPMTLSFAEIPQVEQNNLDQRVTELEASLDQLREQRENEIANTPFVGDARSETKRQIRASYQVKIDTALDELIELRYQLRQRSAGAD